MCHLLLSASEAARFHLAYERADEHAREALARLGGFDLAVPREIKGSLKGKASYQLAVLHFYQMRFDEAEAHAREALARHEDALRGMPPEHTEECLSELICSSNMLIRVLHCKDQHAAAAEECRTRLRLLCVRMLL